MATTIKKVQTAIMLTLLEQNREKWTSSEVQTLLRLHDMLEIQRDCGSSGGHTKILARNSLQLATWYPLQWSNLERKWRGWSRIMRKYETTARAHVSLPTTGWQLHQFRVPINSVSENNNNNKRWMPRSSWKWGGSYHQLPSLQEVSRSVWDSCAQECVIPSFKKKKSP